MSAELLGNDDELEDRRDAEWKLVRKHTDKVYRLINDNLASVGGIEAAAGFCRIDRGDLRKAIDGGIKPVAAHEKRRYLYVDHVIAIMARMRMYNASKATEIGASIVWPAGLLVFPRVEMTDKERADRCEARLRAIGHSMGVGDQLVEEALKTP